MPKPLTREDVIKLESSSRSGIGGTPPKRFLKRYRTEVAASLGSVLSTTAAFPLDSVKTRMQTYRYRGFLDCVRQTYKAEGIGGFWRGLTAPIISVTVVRTVSFSTYQKTKYIYSDWIRRNFGIDPLVHVNTPGNYPNLATVACFGAAGASAGSLITLVACPFELTKISSQVSVLMAERMSTSVSDPKTTVQSQALAASYQNKGTFATAKVIVKHRGLRGLYSGFGLHLTRDLLGTGIYFMTYETGKQIFLTYSGDQTTTSPMAAMTAGGLCGIVSWALIYPIDSVKAIYQKNCLLHERGEKVKRPKIEFFNRRMYRGLSVSMGRSCVLNAIFFAAFENLKKRINELDDIE